MLGNAQILDNGSLTFPSAMGIKTVDGFSPLATGGVSCSLFRAHVVSIAERTSITVHMHGHVHAISCSAA